MVKYWSHFLQKHYSIHFPDLINQSEVPLNTTRNEINRAKILNFFTPNVFEKPFLKYSMISTRRIDENRKPETEKICVLDSSSSNVSIPGKASFTKYIVTTISKMLVNTKQIANACFHDKLNDSIKELIPVPLSQPLGVSRSRKKAGIIFRLPQTVNAIKKTKRIMPTIVNRFFVLRQLGAGYSVLELKCSFFTPIWWGRIGSYSTNQGVIPVSRISQCDSFEFQKSPNFSHVSWFPYRLHIASELFSALSRHARLVSSQQLVTLEQFFRFQFVKILNELNKRIVEIIKIDFQFLTKNNIPEATALSDRLGPKVLGSLLFIILIIAPNAKCSIFGEENIALAKLVVGQIEEIKQLSDALGVAKDQVLILKKINEGIQRATTVILALEEIEKRAQGLDPRSVKRISDLSRLIEDLKGLNAETQKLLFLKTEVADEAIVQAGAQSETAYLMGQEMITTGSALASEAHSASPGRAAQISASGSANSMLSQGVQLQTLAQIAQLQAISLDLQKSQIAEGLKADAERENIYVRQVKKEAGSIPARKLSLK